MSTAAKASPAPWAADPAVQAAFAARVGRLEAELAGVMGVALRHLESGECVAVNGAEPFPMASTYKVPMAGKLLSLADAGALSLSERIEITQRHFEETGPIAQSIRTAGVSLSLENLLELMLTQSNNNATDRILERVGGPIAVTDWIRKAGVVGMRVDTAVNDLLNSFFGLPRGGAAHEAFLAAYPHPDDQERTSAAVNAAFDAAPSDTSTPEAMVALLAALFDGDLLSQESRARLENVMARCETGARRLRGLLPRGTRVVDKTGTIGGTVNDVGMITLPDGRGRLLIAVYTKASRVASVAAREPLLADIARAAFDYFSLRAPYAR